jgi:TrmH family RNA methyltransferase
MVSRSKVSFIRGLCQKKIRDASGLYLVEGPRLVAELMAECPEDAEEVFAVDEWVPPPPPTAHPPRITRVRDSDLAAMSCLQTPNQVMALVRKRPAAPAAAPRGCLTLALDALRDPGNLGTIIRTADWFGIRNIVCSPDCTDLHNPKVVQATMGSLFRVAVAYADLPPWLSTLGDMPVLCTTLDGDPLPAIPSPPEGVVVIGNEARGVSEAVLAHATQRLTIPRYGHAESLNAAVAAGIVMAQLCRGRQG